MAHIIIDGYNLIGISHDNLENARNELVESLREYLKIKDHQITLVFDGWKAGQGDETRTRQANLTVIYSRLGEKADQTIKKMLASSTIPWIVVSSDREISDFAENHDFAAVTSDDFEKRLYSALHSVQQDNYNGKEPFDEALIKYFDDEIEPSPAPTKGNPRKSSKKQKMKKTALKKL